MDDIKEIEAMLKEFGIEDPDAEAVEFEDDGTLNDINWEA